jgi:hypothetical protein
VITNRIRISAPLALLFLLPALTSAQNDSSIVINIPEVGCTIILPSENNFVNEQMDSLYNSVEYIINDTYNNSIEIDGLVKPYFLIRNGNYNMLNCQVSVFDSTAFPNWDSSNVFAANFLINLIERQEPRIELLSSTTSTILLNNCIFNSLALKTYYPELKITLNTLWLCSNFGDYDLSITITYTDIAWKEEALRVLQKIQYLDR